MGIVEAGDDAAPAEVEPLRPGQCRLVRANAACNAVAGNRKRRRGRQ
jgi:hypothetical protein